MTSTIPLGLLYFDGDEPIDLVNIQKHARKLVKYNRPGQLVLPYPLPAWQLDHECFLVLHYGKSDLAALRYLASREKIPFDHLVEVEVFQTPTIDEARRIAKMPALHRRTIRRASGGRQPNPRELREMLDRLPKPASSSGYQAGVIHMLTFVVRGIEPSHPAWIEYTRGAKWKNRL